MIPPSNKLGDYLHYFLSCWLPEHRQVSAHTLAGYKQTFRLLLRYWKARFPERPHPQSDELQVAPLLEFLSHLERERANSVSTRNARLGALKSFFKMVALLDPACQDQARRIRLIPLKRTSVRRFDYLDKREVDILFAGVDTCSPD
jgi:site-specific recombinase XerD